MERKIDYHEHDTDVFTSAATECTGIMYAAPVSSYEMKSYQEVYRFRPHTTVIRDKAERG